jgi:sulfate adenylyltransferase subunit 1 (EFTu-like GTPase family)
MAQFEVQEISRLPSRYRLIVAGTVVDGTVKQGQKIQFPLQEGLYCSKVVTSVEYLDRPTFKGSLVALVCNEYDPQEADVYATLCPPGTVVSVND